MLNIVISKHRNIETLIYNLLWTFQVYFGLYPLPHVWRWVWPGSSSVRWWKKTRERSVWRRLPSTFVRVLWPIWNNSTRSSASCLLSCAFCLPSWPMASAYRIRGYRLPSWRVVSSQDWQASLVWRPLPTHQHVPLTPLARAWTADWRLPSVQELSWDLQ